MRPPALLVLFAALASAVPGCRRAELAPPPAPGPRANVVLIVVDTLRRDRLSCYGGDVATPHLDALAAQGTRFEHAVGSFHQTSMSMAALFTGRTPSLETSDLAHPLAWTGKTWCGLARYARPDGSDLCIPASVPTLAESLREAGLWTIGVATNAFLFDPSGFSRGFDDWNQLDTRPPDERAEATVKRPTQLLAAEAGDVNRTALAALDRRRPGRFFLYVHYMDVHDYGVRQVPYDAQVKRVDAAVGELLAALRARGLEGDTAVVLTADHGEMLGERNVWGHMGNPSFEPVLRIPLLVSPAVPGDVSGVVRTQDVGDVVRSAAGLAPRPAGQLAPGELFLTEIAFQTYRKDGLKAYVQRSKDEFSLWEIEEGGGERLLSPGARPDAARDYAARMRTLSAELATAPRSTAGPTPEDRARLEALGYLK